MSQYFLYKSLNFDDEIWSASRVTWRSENKTISWIKISNELNLRFIGEMTPHFPYATQCPGWEEEEEAMVVTQVVSGWFIGGWCRELVG